MAERKRLCLGFQDEDSRARLADAVRHNTNYSMYSLTCLDGKKEYLLDILLPESDAGCAEIRKVLSVFSGWRPAGPVCRVGEHGAMSGTYNKHQRSAAWKCFEIGCGYEVEVRATNYITVNSLKKGYYRPAAHFDMEYNSDSDDGFIEGVMIDTQAGAPPMKHVLPNQALRQSAKTLDFSAGAYMVKDIEATKMMYEWQQRHQTAQAQHEAKELSDLKQRYEGLKKISDEVFRFMCGLNFQDQPITAQRELVELMRNLRRALEPANSADRKGDYRSKYPRPGVEV